MTGYESKRAMARDKLEDDDTQVYQDHPAQEPVCPACKAGVLYECVACSSNNYPPQRPLVGLTDADWKEIEDMPDTFDQGVAWCLARLKERNA